MTGSLLVSIIIMMRGGLLQSAILYILCCYLLKLAPMTGSLLVSIIIIMRGGLLQSAIPLHRRAPTYRQIYSIYNVNVSKKKYILNVLLKDLAIFFFLCFI